MTKALSRKLNPGFEREQIRMLAEKHSIALPRYTSYPTAIELAPCEESTSIEHLLRNAVEQKTPLSLYVHMPHCPSLCYFCACNKVISSDPGDRDRYLSALANECKVLRTTGDAALTINQVHLGGGSPGYLSPPQLERLLELLETQFHVVQSCEKVLRLIPEL